MKWVCEYGKQRCRTQVCEYDMDKIEQTNEKDVDFFSDTWYHIPQLWLQVCYDHLIYTAGGGYRGNRKNNYTDRIYYIKYYHDSYRIDAGR